VIPNFDIKRPSGCVSRFPAICRAMFCATKGARLSNGGRSTGPWKSARRTPVRSALALWQPLSMMRVPANYQSESRRNRAPNAARLEETSFASHILNSPTRRVPAVRFRTGDCAGPQHSRKVRDNDDCRALRTASARGSSDRLPP
jgi:hypothetical protein